MWYGRLRYHLVFSAQQQQYKNSQLMTRSVEFRHYYILLVILVYRKQLLWKRVLELNFVHTHYADRNVDIEL